MHRLLISASLLLVIALDTAHSDDSVCENPPEINFASVTDTSDDTYSVGATVTYACQYGYVTSGKSRNLRCKRSGNKAEWTKPQFSCTPQSCGDPGYLANGNRIGSLFTFPNSVTYECDPGFNIRGIATRYCQTSGTWSGRLPVCEVVTCNPPSDPEDGEVTAPSLEYGSELNYKCNQGFSLSTEEAVYCTEDGTWSRSDVTCIETLCDIPEAPKYGKVRLSGSDDRPRAGSMAFFSCDGDRIASGSTTSKCLYTGEWTFEPPECLEPCRVEYVSNGKIGKFVRSRYSRQTYFQESEVGKRIEDYEDFFLRCSEKYEVSGTRNRERKVFCYKGKWSQQLLCEPASCRSTPPSATKAEIVDIKMEHRGTVSYHCHPDYKKIAHETVTCDYGKWKGNPPTCRSTNCSTNALPLSGLVKGLKQTYRDGEVFEVMCKEGYQLVDGNGGEIRCQDGTWKVDYIPCIAENCSDLPPTIEHGYAENPSMAHDSEVKYVCNDPYVLVQESAVRCSFGKWVGKHPRCQESRCQLKDLKNLDHVSGESPSFTLPGRRANIICNYGYSAKKNIPICRNGVWDSYHDDSLCDESECEIPMILFGSIREETFGDWYWSWGRLVRTLSFISIPSGNVVSSGKVLWFFCDEPYSVHGSGANRKHIKCSKGRWSTDLQCLRAGEIHIPSTASTRYTWTMEPSPSSSMTTAKPLPPSTTPSSDAAEMTPQADVDEIKPEELVTSPIPTEPPAEECFCEYPVEDARIIAQADGKRLILGDKVRNGSSVLFRCQLEGYDRFSGAREITCRDCKSWHSSEIPSCTPPKKGDAVILLDNDITVLPNGDIEIPKGRSLNLTCAAMETAKYPTWSAPPFPGISFIVDRKERERYRDVVYFTYLEIQNAVYNFEGRYECSIEGKHGSIIHIKIIDPNLRCPEIPEGDEIIIKYELERREGSNVTFSCSNKDQELIGKPVLTCLRNGEWSDSPPQCSVKRCKQLKASDFLRIEYQGDRKVGSLATFHCTNPGRRDGVSRTTCLENGTWAHPTPTCKVPNCTMSDLLSSAPKNAVLPGDKAIIKSLPYNSTVNLTCDNSKIVEGNPEAKCGKEGKWTIDMYCALGCKPPPRTPDSKLILNEEKEIYIFGDRLEFSCPPGMNLTSESQVIMCLKNGWSEKVLPDCKVLNTDNKRDTNRGALDS